MIREATFEDMARVMHVDTLGMSPSLDQWLDGAEDARAIEHDGKVIAVLGLDILWPGVGQVWMASKPGLRFAEGRTLIRSIRLLAREIMETYDLHRLQTYVNGMSVKNQAFNEAVGFSPESVMFMAAPDKGDLILYVHLRRQ